MFSAFFSTSRVVVVVFFSNKTITFEKTHRNIMSYRPVGDIDGSTIVDKNLLRTPVLGVTSKRL